MQLVTLLSTAGLAAVVAAVPQATQTTNPVPLPAGTDVIIFDDPNYQGNNVTAPADGECQSIFPFIESIYVPTEPFIFCQFFNNTGCAGEGSNVTIDSIPEIPVDDVYPAVKCGVLD